MCRNSYHNSFTLLVNTILLFTSLLMPAFAERIVVTNGDFSSGDSGFSSDYDYNASDLTIEGRYGVGYDPNDFHGSWPSGSDHTTGDGLMFIANGSSNTSAIVWQGTTSQDLIVGQTYDFSAWIMDVYTSGAHASLTFKADAEVIGTLTCSSYRTWTRLSGSFTAQNVRPTLTLTNAQSAADGNDFAVDDINIYYEGSTTPPTEAELNTSAATSVSQTSATLGGNITDDGGNNITERGVVYSSTDTKPYIGDTGVTQNENGSGTGTFSEAIGSLSPGTTYYFQAYAINSQGTAYGGVETFTTDGSLPVDLTSFSARCKGRSVILEWITESETDNLGFVLERSLDSQTWTAIASYLTDDALKGQGNTSVATDYTFIDTDVSPETTYSYRLSDVSTDGVIHVYASLSITLDALPETTEMEKAYPNPFNPTTYIAYHLAEDADVNITVFNMLGRQVKTLYSGQQFAGSYHVYWNAIDGKGNKVPSGAYLIRMQTENNIQVQKVLLMR